jgi:hypothetical protein
VQSKRLRSSVSAAVSEGARQYQPCRHGVDVRATPGSRGGFRYAALMGQKRDDLTDGHHDGDAWQFRLQAMWSCCLPAEVT